jgi:hypothetical protein
MGKQVINCLVLPQEYKICTFFNIAFPEKPLFCSAFNCGIFLNKRLIKRADVQI